MAKYHVNDEGVPGVCTAEIRDCKFGGDAQHYSSPEIAQQAYELSMASQTVQKPMKKSRKTNDKPTSANNGVLTSGAYEVASKVERYVHPQGKVIEIQPDGSVRAFKGGKELSTSATAEKLRAGYGAWKREDGASVESNVDAKEKDSLDSIQQIPAYVANITSTPKQRVMVEGLNTAAINKNYARLELNEMISRHKKYDELHAEEEGRIYHYGYNKETDKVEKIPGSDPRGKGFDLVERLEKHKASEERARSRLIDSIKKVENKQTELEEAGLGHMIPDEGNTIRVRTQAQKWLLEDELKGQISDGHWENTANNPYKDWATAKVIVDPKNPGRNFHTTKDNYQLNSKALLDVVGDRMEENVRAKTGKDYNRKAMNEDLKDLRTIFKTHRKEVGEYQWPKEQTKKDRVADLRASVKDFRDESTTGEQRNEIKDFWEKQGVKNQFMAMMKAARIEKGEED